jgi:hypothetical protein
MGDATAVLRISGAGYEGVNGDWCVDPTETKRKGRTKYRRLAHDGSFDDLAAACKPVLSWTNDSRGWMFWDCGGNNQWPYSSNSDTPYPDGDQWAAKESMGVDPMPTLEWLDVEVAVPVAEAAEAAVGAAVGAAGGSSGGGGSSSGGGAVAASPAAPASPAAAATVGALGQSIFHAATAPPGPAKAEAAGAAAVGSQRGSGSGDGGGSVSGVGEISSSTSSSSENDDNDNDDDDDDGGG